MLKFKPFFYILFKVIIAVAAIIMLVSVASADIAPDVPLTSVLTACAIAIVIFLILLILGIIGGASFNQAIIRNGGTDPSWFWFGGEPPGLEAQRAELKRLNDSHKQ